jgi:hypothetical protein
MLHTLSFEKLVSYDSGTIGITVEVELQLSDLTTNFQAKIDTGAESCIFERSFGEALELEVEAGESQKFETATGSFLTFGHSVTLIVEDFQFDSYVYFAEDYNFRRNVLGRFGFLDRVIVAIDDYDGSLYLSQKH